jgi:hypothetical protein
MARHAANPIETPVQNMKTPFRTSGIYGALRGNIAAPQRISQL